ncbi:MAG: 4Fe-4S binding protein [Candidatus Eisenbacteria bacterium]|nr:4Fe-4S binding protein [Candidatus Eisenbacteria bacterium]
MENSPRIGVILCYCGNEIREALDFPEIETFVRALPGVVYVGAEAYPCSRPGVATLANAIKEHRLERIVIAGCTPRLHGKLVAQACESAGLNRWYVDVANVREHCSRVHKDKAGATKKAKALIGASVKKVSLSGSYEPVRATPENSVLVIGGGLSGLGVAAELASLSGSGTPDVTLIEKEEVLGGMLLRLHRPYPYGKAARDIVEERLSKIEGKVRLLKRTELVSFAGAPGRYRARLSTDGRIEECQFGAIVVATGADCVSLTELLESPPLRGISTFGGRILGQIDFERELPNETLKGARSVLFLNVSASRLSHSTSRVYSLVALKNATSLKEASPGLETQFVFANVPSEMEREFHRAKNAGVTFVKCDDDANIEFVKAGLLLKDGVRVSADVVVLPTFLKPRPGSDKLAELLRIPVDAHGFFVESHIKLRPGDFVERGIFVVGSCHSPATILECGTQAMAAASRISRFLGSEIVKAPLFSKIDENVCRGCSRCAEACRWDAIEMVTLDNGLKRANVDETLCTGCGVCSTVCINGAPSLAPVTQRQIKAMVEVVGA